MKVGDKVICVDFSPNPVYEARPDLLANTVYVISNIGEYCGCPYINLLGVPSPFLAKGFKMSRFRKLDELKNKKRIAAQQ